MLPLWNQHTRNYKTSTFISQTHSVILRSIYINKSSQPLSFSNMSFFNCIWKITIFPECFMIWEWYFMLGWKLHIYVCITSTICRSENISHKNGMPKQGLIMLIVLFTNMFSCQYLFRFIHCKTLFSCVQYVYKLAKHKGFPTRRVLSL